MVSVGWCWPVDRQTARVRCRKGSGLAQLPLPRSRAPPPPVTNCYHQPWARTARRSSDQPRAQGMESGGIGANVPEGRRVRAQDSCSPAPREGWPQGGLDTAPGPRKAGEGGPAGRWSPTASIGLQISGSTGCASAPTGGGALRGEGGFDPPGMEGGLQGHEALGSASVRWRLGTGGQGRGAHGASQRSKGKCRC